MFHVKHEQGVSGASPKRFGDALYSLCAHGLVYA